MLPCLLGAVPNWFSTALIYCTENGLLRQAGDTYASLSTWLRAMGLRLTDDVVLLNYLEVTCIQGVASGKAIKALLDYKLLCNRRE